MTRGNQSLMFFFFPSLSDDESNIYGGVLLGRLCLHRQCHAGQSANWYAYHPSYFLIFDFLIF